MEFKNYVKSCALSEIVRQEKIDHFSDKTLVVREYDHAVVVPPGAHAGGLYVCGRFIDGSNVNGRYEACYNDDVNYCDEEVLFLGMVFPTWGHCLTDFISRAWPLLTRAYKVVYINDMPQADMPANFFELLRGLGVGKDAISSIDQPTCFKKVIFADAACYRDDLVGKARYYTKEYDQMVERIRGFFLSEPIGVKEVELKNVDAIYLSRGGWKSGSVDFGEDLVEDAFSRCFDCMILRPEKLSLGEMIRCLAKCKTLIGTEGSVLHNSLFLNKGSNLIDIRKTDYVNWYQPMISHARKLKVTYIDANYTCLLPAGDEPWYGPFLLGVNNRLASFLGCKQSGLLLLKPALGFFKCYVMKRGRKVLSKVKWTLIRMFR